MHNINIHAVPHCRQLFRAGANILWSIRSDVQPNVEMCVYDIIYTELNLLLTLIKRYLVQWV